MLNDYKNHLLKQLADRADNKKHIPIYVDGYMFRKIWPNLLAELNPEREPPKKQPLPKQRPNPQPVKVHTQKRVCFQCQKPGHIWRDCWYNPSKKRGRNKPQCDKHMTKTNKLHDEKSCKKTARIAKHVRTRNSAKHTKQNSEMQPHQRERHCTSSTPKHQRYVK